MDTRCRVKEKTNFRRVISRTAYVLALCCAATLGVGCATKVESSITRYHQLAPQADGKYGSYRLFVPPEAKASLAWAAYANLLKQQLNNHGFAEAAREEDAQYIVFFNYKIDASGGTISRTITTDDSIGGNSAFAKAWNADGGSSSRTVSQSLYSRQVFFNIAKASKPGLETVYESRLLSIGSSGQIDPIMPVFIKALFEGFPGKNGETIRVVLPLEK